MKAGHYISVVIMAMATSFQSMADDQVRLIITKKDSAVQAKGSVAPTSTSDLYVPIERADEVIERLSKGQDVVAVERDVKVYQVGEITRTVSESGVSVSAQSSSPENAPNDPFFSYQEYFLPRTDERKTGSDILGAWEEMGNQSIRPRIAVMDGGFMEEGRFKDIDPVQNYSFVRGDHSNVGDPAWNDESEFDCENGHGAGVYSVVGALTNNGEEVAGIVDAEMYMLQVMRCGGGMMYDSAQALRWAAGGNVDNVPVNETPVHIATFSLGALTPCPQFMQDAIDFAVSKGVKVIVAAGNDGQEASSFSPANCDNVTVTASLSYHTGDKADFSNYGDAVDVSTQGNEIGALANLSTSDSKIAVWSGTSFSTPITTGIFGLGKATAPDLSNDTLESLMMMTLDPIEDAVECETVGCGKGLVNAKKFIKAVKAYETGSFAEVKSALAGTALCDVTPYVMASGVSSRLCNAYRITIADELFTRYQNDMVVYQLYQWPQGESLDVDNASPIFEGVEVNYLLSDIDVSQNAGLIRCVNGQCDTSIVLPVRFLAVERPFTCDE